MIDRKQPDPNLLRKLLRYEPSTGKLFWRKRTLELCHNPQSMRKFNTNFSGKEAFTYISSNGYLVGGIFMVNYKAHRVIWAMVHGEWPAEQIDHINGDRVDNRIENLRNVSNYENGRNRKLSAANDSGVAGVSWDKGMGKWRAQIQHDGRKIYLGIFTDITKARAIRAAAEVKYGFHENHGRSNCVYN